MPLLVLNSPSAKVRDFSSSRSSICLGDFLKLYLSVKLAKTSVKLKPAGFNSCRGKSQIALAVSTAMSFIVHLRRGQRHQFCAASLRSLSFCVGGQALAPRQ